MKKRLTLAACLTALLTAPAALAQASTGTSSSILDALFTPTAIGIVLATLTGIIGAFAGGRAWLTAKRKRIIATGAFHAFHIVEDWAAMDEEENVVDKAAKGLQALDAWLLANGWRPAKPWEQDAARLEFASIHGAQKADVKARAEALQEALGAIGSTAALEPAVAAVASVP
ncbi:hypothetical protein [Corallococcus sp. EGB]|uniref:hypothetical protein n=1 Tax=Corallococcus sp. EGB TaxID=1521117 RepID=UPI001CBB0A65|nr:hypothetical protein [Corallococcus sp. EGB]